MGQKDRAGRLAYIDKIEKELDARNKLLKEEIQGLDEFIKKKVCERFKGKEKRAKDSEALQKYAESIFEESRKRISTQLQQISTLKQTIAKYRQILNSLSGIPITTTSRLAGKDGSVGATGRTGKKGPGGAEKKPTKCFCC